MKVDQREIDFEGVDCTYSSGLGYGLVADCCEQGNEPTGA
jgi:hypothetical protein